MDPTEVRNFYYENNKSLRKTREKFGIGYGCITNIINMHDTSRCHMVTTPEEDHFILTCASKDFLTSKDIVKMIFDTFGHKISHNTVTRRFKKAGYSFLKPRIIQQLSNDQKLSDSILLSICLRIMTICFLNLSSLMNHVFVMIQTSIMEEEK